MTVFSSFMLVLILAISSKRGSVICSSLTYLGSTDVTLMRNMHMSPSDAVASLSNGPRGFSDTCSRDFQCSYAVAMLPTIEITVTRENQHGSSKPQNSNVQISSFHYSLLLRCSDRRRWFPKGLKYKHYPIRAVRPEIDTQDSLDAIIFPFNVKNSSVSCEPP
ncbi:hypothetical protein Tco_0706308 [Tanacetum coccineum]|uniref:Uncharacterized protein n=1 Tax=Tanacetum coccineum TaxID=301880 RepID=A0ABQ4Y981_9ASTR